MLTLKMLLVFRAIKVCSFFTCYRNSASLTREVGTFKILSTPLVKGLPGTFDDDVILQ